MNWSRAEVSSLAVKAARGAGAPPGQAELFGKAAALHLGQGRSADALAEALDALPGGAIMSFPLELNRVLPLALQGGECEIAWSGDLELARSYLDTLPCLCAVHQSSARVLTVKFSAKTADRPPTGRIAGCEALIARMTALAAWTFVPESAASRSSGAGAGLSDND